MFGEKSLSTLGPKIWNSLPEDVEDLTSLSKFLEFIKTWYGPEYTCNICKYSGNPYHCTINIFPLVSKIFERIICKQLTTFFNNTLSKYQCRFRKGHGTQHCLLLMLEKWKKALDNKESFGLLSIMNF